jgi:hypothetical protein
VRGLLAKRTGQARYAYHYDRKARRLCAVAAPHLYRTQSASPPLELWELDDEQWRTVAPRPYERRARPPSSGVRQLALPVFVLLLVPHYYVRTMACRQANPPSEQRVLMRMKLPCRAAATTSVIV